MVALGFAIVLGVPFALGCAAMALPISRLAKLALAAMPLAAFALAIVDHAFWIGDIGGPVISVIAIWAWLIGTAASGDVRSLARFVVRHARA